MIFPRRPRLHNYDTSVPASRPFVDGFELFLHAERMWFRDCLILSGLYSVGIISVALIIRWCFT